jgi:hypothetical protein
MVRIGGGIQHIWDLAASPMVREDLTTSNTPSVVNAQAPGFVYDSSNRQFVAWSGGATVYTLDLDTNTWTRQDPAPSNTVIPPSVTAAGGTFGRFQYIPSKNAFIAVNATNENVYIYRLSAIGVRPNAPVLQPIQ